MPQPPKIKPQIHFRSDSPFTPDQRAAIQTQAESLAAQREWWFAPPNWLPDPTPPDHLEGHVILLRAAPILTVGIPIPGNAIPERENALMGYLDLLATIDILAQLSRDHPTDWTLSVERQDPPIGRIAGNTPDAPLRQYLQRPLDRWNFSPDEQSDPDLHESIRQAFAYCGPLHLEPTDTPLPPESEAP